MASKRATQEGGHKRCALLRSLRETIRSHVRCPFVGHRAVLLLPLILLTACSQSAAQGETPTRPSHASPSATALPSSPLLWMVDGTMPDGVPPRYLLTD